MSTITCANCGIAIKWQPTVVDGQTYCCLGCASGGPCTCDYSNLPCQDQCRIIVQRHNPAAIPLPPPYTGSSCSHK